MAEPWLQIHVITREFLEFNVIDSLFHSVCDNFEALVLEAFNWFHWNQVFSAGFQEAHCVSVHGLQTAHYGACLHKYCFKWAEDVISAISEVVVVAKPLERGELNEGSLNNIQQGSQASSHWNNSMPHNKSFCK